MDATQYPRLQVIYADPKYNKRTLDRWLRTTEASYRIEVVGKAKGAEGFVPVKIRWVAEQSIAGLNRCRRLSKDYEYETSSSETWVQIAAIQRMLRRARPDANNQPPRFTYPRKSQKVA